MEITKSMVTESNDIRSASVIYIKSVGSTQLLALEIKPLVDILDSKLTIEDVPVILGLLQTHRSNNNRLYSEDSRLIYLKNDEKPDIDPGEIVVWLSIQDLLLLQSCGLTNDRAALEDTHILKSWPLLYGIDTEIYSAVKYLQQTNTTSGIPSTREYVF